MDTAVLEKIKNRYASLGDEGIPGFDWSPYETGWTGGMKMVPNKKVTRDYAERLEASGDKIGAKVVNKDIVYSHTPYAAALYERMTGGATAVSPKDTIRGTVYDVKDIKAISDHEILVDTTNGMSAIIDMNKERQYLDTIAGGASVHEFINAIKSIPGSVDALIASGMSIRIVGNGRASLWDGHLAKIEADMLAQINNAGTPGFKAIAFNAKVESINMGGFIVDIMGVKCFMPGSLSAPGVLTDFNSMLDKVIPVMVVNYLPSSGFVVSYKKYLDAILPGKIEKELFQGKQVSARVTGRINNGLFVQFKDEDKEWIFSGLIHRSTMSKEFEKRFDKREFVVGDEIIAYIYDIIEKDGAKKGEKQYRIVLSDSYPEEPEGKED